MKIIFTTILLVLLINASLIHSYNIVFTVVYPGVFTNTQYFEIQIVDINQPGELSFPLTTDPIDNVTHSYMYQTNTEPSEDNIKYKYIFYNTTKVIVEDFYRSAGSCRIATVENELYVLKNEYFNQSQLYLGLNKLPLIGSNGNGNPPAYYDDNQVMTLSFLLESEDLDFLLDPDNEGEEYVKTNMSFVSLTTHKFLSEIKIRRAGGQSLDVYPYSYQVKMNNQMNLGGPDRVFKLKAYPDDYEDKGADIVADKTAADITYALGAPINYISFVRVYINHVDQGIYGMLEKVDEVFIERRWPYEDTGLDAGVLYKVKGTFELLIGDSWFVETPDYLNTQGKSASFCCPCYADDCEVKYPDCRVQSEPGCDDLSCCSCSWESNGKLEVEHPNCESQEAYYDFFPLGESILNEDQFEIDNWLDTLSYIKSIIAELAVMNPDGYVYNEKNYYWYREIVTGKFYLILYDQDTSFNENEVQDSGLDLYSWTYEATLTDGLFLPTLMDDSTLKSAYTQILTDFVTYLYRSDQTGPLFQRMNTMAEFINQYNPERYDVPGKVYSYINYFIVDMSSYIREEFDISSLPPISPIETSTCDV